MLRTAKEFARENRCRRDDQIEWHFDDVKVPRINRGFVSFFIKFSENIEFAEQWTITRINGLNRLTMIEREMRKRIGENTMAMLLLDDGYQCVVMSNGKKHKRYAAMHCELHSPERTTMSCLMDNVSNLWDLALDDGPIPITLVIFSCK